MTLSENKSLLMTPQYDDLDIDGGIEASTSNNNGD
ncbi:hypothetical protein Lepto7375DRAFT_4874 [Leptolyngbya sp. PCC 7375]|nr:hypothetical protein Lepto7375DRAFT_0642 [Leptolyngbya sp. PCC 7375]EKU99079.1 hypothetical protein Lepto7375DRAFT_8431 [Leptolyngbya sp. PCC 7375]EKU99403.1 hypothetical protein Lepto7375DRAFT_1441 [Leptolyngbya sp. PCC 7375]EKV00529.1 hypothetical protein Lepto7375DRAFT_2649 [Leptolyngbya sp. PCC 7375]EKV01275.1 hypothetical protein Lepto7375DRAFT_3434 [Leptolyngbya sp. PCC 7375]